MYRITAKHTGKMEEIQSVSTAKSINANCIKRSKIPGSVCGECYVDPIFKRYPNVEKKMIENTHALTGGIIPDHLHPRINAAYFRFESFGELHEGEKGINQLVNYMTLARKNPRTTFALWTKEKALVWKYLRDFDKPKNVIFIYSSLMINIREALPAGFDKVFTTGSKEHAGKSFINCGDKKCIDCLTCYDVKDRKKYINEVLK